MCFSRKKVYPFLSFGETSNHNRLTNIEDNLVTKRGREVEGIGEWNEGLKKFKLVVDRWSATGEHGIGNAISIPILAGRRTMEEKEQLGGLFYKLYTCLAHVVYT